MSRARILRVAGFLYDTCACVGSFLVANIMIFGLDGIAFVPGIQEKTLAFTLLSVFSIYIMRLNGGMWRYVSIPDLIAIVKAATFAVIIFTIGNFMISRGENISRAAIVLSWIFMIFSLGGGRLLYRAVSESKGFDWFWAPLVSGKHVLLYPYSDASDHYIRAIRRQPTAKVSVAGVIHSKRGFKGAALQGRPVLGAIADIELVLSDQKRKGTKIGELIVTDPQVSGNEMGALLETCNRAGITITRLPNFLEGSPHDGNTAPSPKPIRLVDLLGRSEVQIDLRSIAELVNAKSVLITGAGGSIGSELCRQIASFGPSRLIMAELSEYNLYKIDSELTQQYPDLETAPFVADVRDKARITSLINSVKPDVVFHAAALKHVPLMEANPLEAIKTNILGTANTAAASLAAGTKIFILISTDKAVNSTNIMGATKRAAEAFCQSLDLAGAQTRFATVRFGNVLGSSGSVVPRFRDQIARGGPVTVTHPEITRYFMTIPEAVRLVLQASSSGMRGEADRGKILVLDMGDPVKIIDLARRMIQLAGYKPDVDIPIEITGLRPGEKLYEELLAEQEVTIEGTENGFVAASARVIEHKLLSRSLDQISDACSTEDTPQAIKLLKHIVPSYSPAVHSADGLADGKAAASDNPQSVAD